MRVPFRSYDEIRGVANETLASTNISRAIPVPIDHIVEFGYDIGINPIPGMKRGFDVDAFISVDLRSIYIDEETFMAKNNVRARFSLAHELGHRVLHADVFRELKFETTAEWRDAMAAIDVGSYNRLEWQANAFAGLLLVPYPELRAKFDSACQMAIESGVDFRELSDEGRAFVTRLPGVDFGVSQQTAAIRCEKEGLWRTIA